MTTSEESPSSPAKSLFLGKINPSSLFPFPSFSVDENETLSFIVGSVEKFMESYAEKFREFDAIGAFPDEYIEALKELGLFGLIIPEEYGGLGLTSRGYARVMQEVARFDASTAITVGAHSSIGLKGLLLFGSDSQKEKYLPRLATGEIVAAFCLTEPSSGSDASSIRTKVTSQPDGSWRLSGEKLWITNGSFADFFTVFARHTDDPQKLSAFIVERGFGGVSNGPKEDKMGIRASATTTVVFEDVCLPAEALLGQEGKGFKIAMSVLNSGRTGLGGGCVGAMKESLRRASAHVVQRAQFGKKLSEFELIQKKLVTMAELCYATESVVEAVGGLIDSGSQDYSIEAAIGKVFGTEALWYVANEALQIAGGNGFMRDYPYERVVRDSRINLIFEGTNEILRIYIALSGLRGVGAYLQELGAGISNFFQEPFKGFDLFTDYASKKISSALGGGAPVEFQTLPSELEGSVDILVRYTHRLAQAGENAAKTYRKAIVSEQLVLKHLADIAIELFVIQSVLSRIGSSKNPSDREIKLVSSYVQGAKHRMAASLRRLEKGDSGEVVRELAQAVVEAGGPWW